MPFKCVHPSISRNEMTPNHFHFLWLPCWCPPPPPPTPCTLAPRCWRRQFLKHCFRASPHSEELKCSVPKQLPSCHFLWLFLEGLRDCTVTSSPESILETWHLQSSAPPSIKAFPSVGQLVVLEVFLSSFDAYSHVLFMKIHVYKERLLQFLRTFSLCITSDFR